MAAHSGPSLIAELTPKQAVYADALASGRYRYLAYGGAIRGTKTWCVLLCLLLLCRVFPRSRWAIVRKDLPTLKRNTIPSFEKLRPDTFVASLNQSTWSYRCRNGSELLLFAESIKDDPDLDRWKGLEVNGFVLEEANELAEKSWHKAIERAGSWIIPPTPEDPTPRQPPPTILLTFNPASNWVRRVFYEPHKTGTLRAPYFYLPATIADNPFVAPEFLASLKNLPDAEYKRFVEGDWEANDDPDQLVKFEWVLAAQQRAPIPGKRRLGVDVARYGDDKTVLAWLDGATLTGIREFSGLSIDVTADHVQAAIIEGPIDAPAVKVDSVGLGAGAVDLLRRRGFNVSEVISGAAAVDVPGSFFRFKNLRSQMWWNVRELLRTGELALAECPPKLVEDLTAPKYSISGDKMIAVESKDDIKKRIGRSTDYADALVYALFEPPRLTVGGALVTF